MNALEMETWLQRLDVSAFGSEDGELQLRQFGSPRHGERFRSHRPCALACVNHIKLLVPFFVYENLYCTTLARVSVNASTRSVLKGEDILDVDHSLVSVSSIDRFV